MQLDRSATSRSHRLASRVCAVFAVLSVSLCALPASAATLEQIKQTGHIKLGYFADARPFTQRSDSGVVEGYSAALCQLIAEQVKTQLGLSDLTVDWVPVTGDSNLRQVQPGSIDVLCTPISATLTRRQDVAFSIPVFPGGVRALLRADTAAQLREALAENPNVRPVWRGSPAAKVLGKKTFAIVSGTTAESWVTSRIATLQIDSKTVSRGGLSISAPAAARRQDRWGLRRWRHHAGRIDESSRQDFVMLDRLFTCEPLALACPARRRRFSSARRSNPGQRMAPTAFDTLYTKWFGEFDDNYAGVLPLEHADTMKRTRRERTKRQSDLQTEE